MRKHLGSISNNANTYHLFPQALLKSAGIRERDVFKALNCALITWRTNRNISSKEPVEYLKERVKAGKLGEKELKARLRSHLVPFEELAVGGYDSLAGNERTATIERDYNKFLRRRAKVVRAAIEQVCAGHHLDLRDAFEQ